MSSTTTLRRTTWLTALLVGGWCCTPAQAWDLAEPDLSSVGGNFAAVDRAAIEHHRRFIEADRRKLGNGVVHSSFEVRLGHGEFDVVRIHRVVKERRAHRPARTRGAVFMLHGASLTFEAIYLQAGAQPPDAGTSVAIYLAENGIDVWGMDYAWTLVPIETTDFSFMEGWGVERDARHALAAMSIVRLIRGLTGQGFGPMNLLGYSYGVGVIYAAAGEETRRHRLLRNIRGLIPVDQVLKYAPEDEPGRLDACAIAADVRGLIDMGVFQNQDGVVLGLFSELASAAPDDDSPLIPGLTNRQAALFLGTNTFLLGPPGAPFWHFVAGLFDESGLPVGLLYSDPARWIRLLGSLPPYMPYQAQLDMRETACNEADVRIDDRLGRISVPILYIGAGGGFGTLGDFTSSLTASGDVTNYSVDLQPDELRFIDFGHADLFLSDGADGLVWEVLRQWLVDHDGSRWGR